MSPRPIFTKPPRPIFTKPPRPIFKKPPPVAVWPGSSFEKWSRQWVNKHFWRVEHVFLSPEDALQECALIFVFCLDRYTTVDNPKWLMSLFIRVVTTSWIRFTATSTINRELYAESTEESEPAIEPPHNITFNDGPMAVAFAQLSKETRDVFITLMQAPSEVMRMVFDRPLTQAVPPATEINRRIRRFFGITTKVDIIHELSGLMAIHSALPKFRKIGKYPHIRA